MTAVRGSRFSLAVLTALLALLPWSGHAGMVAASTQTSYRFKVNTLADTKDAKPGDGVCADARGHCSLRAAIEETDALPFGTSTTVTVPKGKYQLTLGSLGVASNRGIAINGASRSNTTISGNNTFTIIGISTNVTASLRGLTIRGGKAQAFGSGGGIANAGTLSVAGAIITHNATTTNGSGGAIDNTGTMNVSNTTFSYNTGYLGGGAIDNTGTMTVELTTFSHNTARLGGAIANSGTLVVADSNGVYNSAASGEALGGFLYNLGGTVTLDNCSLYHNTAGTGGAIDNVNGGTVTVMTASFTNNTAGVGGAIYNDQLGMLYVSSANILNNVADDGGGIYNQRHSTASVAYSTLGGNTVTDYGGGIYNDAFATLAITNSTLSTNAATSLGGGIYNESNAALSVQNSTFAQNVADGSAGLGGGGIFTQGQATVMNSTFSANTAITGSGGGIENLNTLTVMNSTFSDNAATAGGGLDNAVGGAVATLTGTIMANSPSGANCAGPITDLNGYNLDSGTSCGFGPTSLTNTAPNLGPLANNGGPTQTMALLVGSPAIDFVHGCPATDQRGASYPRPDDPLNEVTCDIGAYESFLLG